jgi:transcriptional regulator with XRE-family HTH domain
MNIGKAIRDTRKSKGIPQEALVELVGLSQTSISLIEHGKKRPHLKNLIKIAKALEVSVPFLYVLALEENDVDPSKKELFNALKPSLVELLR